MWKRKSKKHSWLVLCVVAAVLAFRGVETFAQGVVAPVAVCATTTDLEALILEVGGDEVETTVFTKGPQDPHFVEARPSFVKALNKADLYVQVGLDLEIGWAPVLLRTSRNPKILPGAAGYQGATGYVDASRAISPLEVATVPVDRSMGDIHPLGNPHYLLDPLNGVKVARVIRDRLIEMRPQKRKVFSDRYAAFERKVAAALLGAKLLEKYKAADLEKLFRLLERGGVQRFLGFLEKQGQKPLLGGWLATMLPHMGTKTVADHNLWPYFARRFGISVIGFLEPRPGISPTTRHLTALIRRMRAEKVKAILSSPYFDPRHARLVSENTGARVVAMAHQVGGRKGTESYLQMVDYNVRSIAAALENAK